VARLGAGSAKCFSSSAKSEALLFYLLVKRPGLKSQLKITYIGAPLAFQTGIVYVICTIKTEQLFIVHHFLGNFKHIATVLSAAANGV